MFSIVVAMPSGMRAPRESARRGKLPRMHGGFLLDPDVAYFNHGGYGACPVAVFEEYQRLQRELEKDPTHFFVRRFEVAMWEARTALATFVGAAPSDLVFTPNATSGLNAVIRSLRIRPEEEILTTKHEYGAILRTLGFIRANVVLVEPDELIENISIRTRAVVLSHITSPTALVLPIEDVCAAARRAGVLSIVDGAHVAGHVPLDIESVGADVYAGNCHKWLCAPKGSGFLWARPEHQEWIEPLVVSWGYQDDAGFGERHGWQGTRDPAAYLAVPAAIEAHTTFDLAAMKTIADEAERRLGQLGLRPLRGDRAPFMRALTVKKQDPVALQGRLYSDHGVELPVYDWEDTTLARVSIGPYTDEADLERLVDAVRSSV
jgi:isopenicillin-N epimerase